MNEPSRLVKRIENSMMNINSTVTVYDEPESELLTEDLDILKECDIEEMENINPLDSIYIALLVPLRVTKFCTILHTNLTY